MLERHLLCLLVATGAAAVSRHAVAQGPPPGPGYPTAPYPGPQYPYPPPGSYPAYPPPPGYGYPPPYYPAAPYPYGYGYPAPPPPAAERPRPAAAPDKPPPASLGFQLALRMGIAIPTGLATGAGGDTLGERYSSQFLADIELGAKVTEALFVGAYLGFGAGAEGRNERIESYCDDDDGDGNNDIECSVVSLRFGVMARWSFSPAEAVNPWIAYGIGFESQSQSIYDRVSSRRETTTASGIEFARISGGLDWRLGKAFGLGPSLETALGSYLGTSTEVNGETTFDGDIEDSAIHCWVTLGLRGVFFP